MPCVDNKNLIYNIKELPETFSVAGGDLLLIETEEGTNILDYDNFVIGRKYYIRHNYYPALN